MSRDFMALITPTGLPVPIVRQGTLVYLSPTVIPFSSSDAPRSELEINSLMAEIDLAALDVELRGVTDIADLAYDHVSKISSLIAAAQKGRQKQNFKHMDYWEVDDKAHQLIRHHVKPRSARDPRQYAGLLKRRLSPARSLRIDPDAPSVPPLSKSQRIACVVASVTNWICGQVGVAKVTTKDGIDIPVEVNYDSEEYKEELKLSEPIIWDITREFPEEAQKIGMNKEMKSMKHFTVYAEKPIEECTEEQIRNAPLVSNGSRDGKQTRSCG